MDIITIGSSKRTGARQQYTCMLSGEGGGDERTNCWVALHQHLVVKKDRRQTTVHVHTDRGEGGR